MLARFRQFVSALSPFAWRALLALSLLAVAVPVPVPASPAAQNAANDQSAPALPRSKKLVLTDGTFQIVREYQREGDRVRYYSLERSAWEEIPASLVDWAATEKTEAQQVAADKALEQKLNAADHAAAIAGIDSDKSFEVGPGVILPDDVGLYALADNQVHALEQSVAVSSASKLRATERIATGVPLIPGKATIEVKPKHAKLRIRAGEVEFYFRTADGREPKVELLKAAVLSDRRKLDTISTNVFGQNSYKGNQINLLSSEAARGLYRFTLEQNLPPGEYALVELTHENNVDLYVWDFGVDNVSGNAGAFLHDVVVK